MHAGGADAEAPTLPPSPPACISDILSRSLCCSVTTLPLTAPPLTATLRPFACSYKLALIRTQQIM